MRFRATPAPAAFTAAVAVDIARVEAEAEAGPVSFKGHEKWKDFKQHLAPATHGKCGYCEVDVVTVDRFKGDVEHYRPKGRIDRLIIDDNGKVRAEVLFTSGYHWLAYEWTNYILTCNPCNSAHKGNLFPLRVESAIAPSAGAESIEQPLLLNPFGRKDPTKHLTFDELGVVGPRNRSPFGRATIAVCGLDRTPLEKKRRRLAGLVKAQIDVFADADAGDDAVNLALANLADLGKADREHAGMVRSMFSAATQLPWSFVEGIYPPTPDS